MKRLLNSLTNFFKNKAKANFWLYTLPVHFLGLVGLGAMAYFGDWNYLLHTFVFYFLFGCIGMAVGLHRYWGHAAFEMPKWKERFVTLMGVFNGYGSIFPWVMVHEKGHHVHSDTEEDPHTPNKGMWYAFLTWHKEQKYFDQHVSRRVLVNYVRRGFVNDKFYQILNDYHMAINYGTLILIALLFGWKVALYGFWMGIWFTLLNTSTVTAFSHKKWFGYRNFETKDNSVNNRVGAILTFGEMLHNNHHRYWKATNNSQHWSEIDISGLVIERLRKR
jgi:stearoyl-CoA desaturase (delta-9 desaturase)